jgi:hypothetical protein
MLMNEHLYKEAFMISLVIVPTETTLRIEIPKEMLNKPIHVEICPEGDEVSTELPEVDAGRLAEVEAFYKTLQTDLSGFKFNRDEAHER